MHIVIPQQKTPYTILGISLTASWDEIKTAFRNLIKILHPDKAGDEEKAKEVISAYTVLKEKFGK